MTDARRLRELLERAAPRPFVWPDVGDDAAVQSAIADYVAYSFRRDAAQREAVNELPALLDRIDALEAALRPFAERCDETVRPSDGDDSGVTVRTRHLRAARAALRETPR